MIVVSEYLLFLLSLSYDIIIAIPSSHMHGPSFIKEPQTLTEFSNSTGVIIHCYGQGNPSPFVSWLDAANKEIHDIPGIREKLSNGSLYFYPFTVDNFHPDVHQTSYKCLLTNTIGRILSRECKVRAEIISAINVFVPNVEVMSGNVAVMKCLSNNRLVNSLQCSTIWLKDDPMTGRAVITPNHKYVLTYSGQLHVLNVNAADTRMRFYCQLYYEITGEKYFSQPGRITIAAATIRTNSAPKIEFSSADTIVQIGDTVDLTCNAQSHPAPTYKWFNKVSGSLHVIRGGAAVFVKPQSSVLHIARVQSSDSSTYVCVVSNEIGEDRREIKLRVVAPLLVFIRPQKLVVDYSSQAMFNCSVQGGTEEETVHWLKNGHYLKGDGKSVAISDDGRSLLLVSVSRNDCGMYQCYAHTTMESAQASAELILGAAPPVLEETFQEQIIHPGLYVSLKCMANGNPPPRISWLLNGGLIQPSSTVFLGSFSDTEGNGVGHMNITNTRVEHSGLYSCVAKNYLGAAHHSAMLNIYGPPTASKAALNLTAVCGSVVDLHCPVSGYPLSSTVWYFGGESIVSDKVRKIFNNGTLHLSQLQEEKDEGKFTCDVYNPEGLMATGTIFLNIMAPPEIMPFHLSSNLREGAKTNIVCSVTSGDLPITFSWRKDGKAFAEDIDIQEHVIDMVSTLRINNLDAKHSGYYTCIATNPVSSTNFTAELIVKVSPRWTVQPQNATVLHHHSVLIHCHASGYPLPRISWMKANENKTDHFLLIESNSRLLIHNNGSIEIKNAERQHEGFYTCQADNGIGNPIAKTIFFKVNIPAHFVLKNSNHSGIAGHDTILSCEAKGDPPIRITWSTFATALIQIKETSNSIISELHLNRISRQHAGIYRCIASNSFGYDHAAILLTVKERPESPKNVCVIEVGSRWLKLNWTVSGDGKNENENDDDGNNTYFILQYRPIYNHTDWLNITILNRNFSDNYRIEALRPNTLYTVSVVVVNEIGHSDASPEITFKTLQEVPSGYPPDITFTSVNTDYVTLKWKAISSDLWNGELLGYRVRLFENNGSLYTRIKTIRNVNSDQLIMNLTNLKSYVTYEISLCAFNEMGEGPSSTLLAVTTLESTPTAAPQQLECSPLTSQSIRVRWKPPSYEHWNGVLRSYKLYYHPTTPILGKQMKFAFSRTTNTETIIFGLDKWTNYTVRVAALTNSGEGIPSAPIQCLTMEDVPGAPLDIKALVMSSDSILVVWTDPSQLNGNIINYHVHMKNENTKSIKKEIIGWNEKKKLEFRHLTENQRYEFWITAATLVGEGQSSIKVSRTLSSKIPATISSFSQAVVGIVGSFLNLPCHAVGLPTPAVIWKKFDRLQITSSHIKILSDKSLNLNKLTNEDAGNYSCFAENVFGVDRIDYHVVIWRIPSPPHLHLMSVSKNTVSLNWNELASSNGMYECPITAYVINVKSKYQQFSINVDPDRNTFDLSNLHCGSNYQFNMQSCNSVGCSHISNIIHGKTSGSTPEIYNEDELFYINSSSVTLYLDSWPEKECVVQYFAISYRCECNDEWSSVGNNNITPQPITIADLSPSTTYFFKITIVNEGGHTRQDFTIKTQSLSKNTMSIEQHNQIGMTTVIRLFLVVSVVLCLISFIICIIFVHMQKNSDLYVECKNGNKIKKLELQQKQQQKNINCEHYQTQQCYIQKKCSSNNKFSFSLENECDDSKVHPYATFTVPSKLQAFDYCNINSSNNSNSSNSSSSSISINSNGNIEIACISNQQTLPLGKTSLSSTTVPTLTTTSTWTATTATATTTTTLVTPISNDPYSLKTSSIISDNHTDTIFVANTTLRKTNHLHHRHYRHHNFTSASSTSR